MDYFFLYDDYKNRANIMAVMILTKFEAEKVKILFKERTSKIHRMRQRLVRYIGEYFWETIP